MKSLGQNKCSQSVMIADTTGFVRFGRSSFRVSLSNSVRAQFEAHSEIHLGAQLEVL